MPSAREYEPGHGQGHDPVPAVHSPGPATLSGLVIRAPGASAGRGAPGLRQRDVLARRGDSRGGHHRKFPGIAAGIAVPRAAGEFDGAGGLAAAKVPVSSSQPCRAPGDGGAATVTTPRTLAGDRASTGHVWITIWRRYGRDPFRTFSQPSQPNGICPGNRGWGRQGFRARPLAPHRHPAYLHGSSTSLVHSPLHS